MDESSFQDNKNYKNFGWCKRGEKLNIIRENKLETTKNLMIFITLKPPYFGYFIYENITTDIIFVSCVEKLAEKGFFIGKTLILDNAPYHKSKFANDKKNSWNFEISYLPPYDKKNSELNPTELIFGWLKK